MSTRLSFIKKDLLTEVGTIGTGNAASALAGLIGKKITINVPKVDIVPFSAVSRLVGGAEQVKACIFLDVHGDLPGTVLVLFDRKTAEELLSALIPGSRVKFFSLTPMEESALNEIGNILSGAYLSALADFTGKSMLSGLPTLAVDIVEAVLSVPMTKLGPASDVALLIQATFFEEQKHSGSILFIPDQGVDQRLLDTFGVVDNDR